MSQQKPKKWVDCYPQGTKEGDEEYRFFIALARNIKFEWRSTGALQKEANLSAQRMEEILTKYFKKGMVFQNPKKEDSWGYWERVPQMLQKVQKSVSDQDKSNRINQAANSNP